MRKRRFDTRYQDDIFILTCTRLTYNISRGEIFWQYPCNSFVNYRSKTNCVLYMHMAKPDSINTR